MLVVIDGPEKAGKTTLIASLCDALRGAYEVRTRRWGVLDPDDYYNDLVYAAALSEDLDFPGVAIWDRSWASESVYGRLLGRASTRLIDDPWAGEWLYGRATPLKFILPGPDPIALERARTPDDLPVSPDAEQREYEIYGREYGWCVFPRGGSRRLSLETLTRAVINRLRDCEELGPRDPRQWCGPPTAAVIFVGERGSTTVSVPGAVLPFTSKYTEAFGRILGRGAFRVGWTNAYDDQHRALDRARHVIACGHEARKWVELRSRNRDLELTVVPHPAALYRWGKMRGRIGDTESRIRDIVATHVPGGL